jgi:hypothetical protein
MRKKVVPFPPLSATASGPAIQKRSQILIQVGAQRYTLNIPSVATPAQPQSTAAVKPDRLPAVQVETRFVRLRQAAELGDRIDGWRVCWLGGWDKGRVLFVVMVKRVVRAVPM